MKEIISIILLFLSLACTPVQQKKDQWLAFDEKNMPQEQAYGRANGWYTFKERAHIDTLTRYEGENSLLIFSLPEDSVKEQYAYYRVLTRELEGDSIQFSGKYKFSDAKNAKVGFGIYQYGGGNGSDMDSLMKDINVPETKDWIDFKLKVPVKQELGGLLFSVIIQGDIKLWLTNCRVEVDGDILGDRINARYEAEEDKRYEKGSEVVLGNLSPQMHENLEVLGKVWGFMKYYHPEVTQGKYNWDYELFGILPKVAKAKDKKERCKLLNAWINKYGKITETQDYSITDSSKYTRIINLDWISDQHLFDDQLISKLEKIRDAKRSDRFNYYVIPYQIGDKLFDREKSYANIKWEDQGFRILSLFRLWNAMEYCFPYVELTDRPWSSLLNIFIPRFVEANSNADYKKAIAELSACINDSHGVLQMSYEGLENSDWARKYCWKQILVDLTEAKEGEIVVKDSRTFELDRGDIICTIDGEKVGDIIERLSPYFPASNRPVLVSRILDCLLKSNKSSLDVTCIRNGKILELTLKNWGTNRRFVAPKSMEYDFASKGIVYIHERMKLTNISADLAHAKGLIIDLRKGPNTYSALYPLLLPKPETFMWFSSNDKLHPGNYKFDSEGRFGTDNPDYFKGKVAILVDENVQSHLEFCAMAYRKAPKSAVIGSTTSGADGNFASLCLPGNFRLTYTGLGAYYPDWKLCQRKGVDIDIEARSTAEQIRNGRDAVIEKAIEYITE